MSDLFWLTDARMARPEPFFTKSRCKTCVDDRRVSSGIVFIARNGLRWRDAPAGYGPPKTLYNRWKRWNDMERQGHLRPDDGGEERTVAIDATYPKAYRTATGLGVEKGGAVARDDRCPKAAFSVSALAATVTYWL